MIWRACRCRENELVFTRDLSNGSLLSTFSVGRAGGGAERRRRVEYDKAETCPQVPVGAAGTTTVIPFTESDFFYFLSSPSCSVFLLFTQFHSSCFTLPTTCCNIRWSPSSVFVSFRTGSRWVQGHLLKFSSPPHVDLYMLRF